MHNNCFVNIYLILISQISKDGILPHPMYFNTTLIPLTTTNSTVMSQAELIISGTATETAIIVLFNTVGVTAEKTDISITLKAKGGITEACTMPAATSMRAPPCKAFLNKSNATKTICLFRFAAKNKNCTNSILTERTFPASMTPMHPLLPSLATIATTSHDTKIAAKPIIW